MRRFKTLRDFYRSNQWSSFRDTVIAERINEESQIICEYCGKPIVRSYDLIAHHCHIYLTEQNVNDVLISLNPDNIQLVHHHCHNKIHDKLGYIDRRVYLVYGSPLSGKTTWVHNAMNIGDLMIDMDSIWQCISGCERYKKPPRLTSNVFGVRDKLLEQVKYRVGKWQNAYIIGGYPLIGERERLIRILDAEEIFIDTSREECILRLNKCDDRDLREWTKYIDTWWEKYSPRRPQAN